MSEQTPTDRPVYRIRRPEQLRALGSSIRHRMVAAFEALGACTVPELADSMGVQAETLFYDLKLLVSAGLVRRVGSRETGRRKAAVYELVARDFEVRVDEEGEAFRDAYATMGSALLRWADRAHAAALESPDTRQAGPERERSLAQFHARLGPEALRALNRRLESIEAFLAEAEDASAPLYVVTLVTSPA